MSRARCEIVWCALLLLWAATGLGAVQPAKPPTDNPGELERRFVEAFGAGKLDEAQAALERMIAVSPADPNPHYNMACVLVRRGNLAGAEASLRRAVDLGFTSFDTMRRDEDLAPLRETETFRSILARAASLQDQAIDRRLAALRKGFGEGYQYEKDEVLRLAFVSGFEAASFAAARREVAQLEAWWRTQVLPEGGDAPERAPAWVTVIWPNRADWNRWAQKTFGDRFGSVGGIYDHSRKELVAQDLGPTMRHEFWHVLHWRDMDRRGQVHPVWIQEGLCSLVEDLEHSADDAAKFRPVASWRTNSLKRLQAAGRLPTMKSILEMTPERFSGTRPLANYAAARALFLFLADRGHLRAWYGAYVEGYGEDRTGARAFERVFGKPLAEVEKDWRAWLKQLPEVAEINRPGEAELPFGINEQGAGDGLPITSLSGAAREAGLRPRDVLTSINGKPVRDAGDLARVLGEFKAGETVEVGYRRGGTTGTARVTLLRRE
ncbi:MAG: PDZ domain-containing protein [Phycisphaerae bacterium]|nr:PDZ domain-containing protein [Phycisphaerae bacterium]